MTNISVKFSQNSYIISYLDIYSCNDRIKFKNIQFTIK